MVMNLTHYLRETHNLARAKQIALFRTAGSLELYTDITCTSEVELWLYKPGSDQAHHSQWPRPGSASRVLVTGYFKDHIKFGECYSVKFDPARSPHTDSLVWASQAYIKPLHLVKLLDYQSQTALCRHFQSIANMDQQPEIQSISEDSAPLKDIEGFGSWG